jgi:hypothetical protein
LAKLPNSCSPNNLIDVTAAPPPVLESDLIFGRFAKGGEMRVKKKAKANPELAAKVVNFILFRNPELGAVAPILAFIVGILWRFSRSEKHLFEWIGDLEERAGAQGIPLLHFLSLVTVSLLTPRPKSTRPVIRSRKSGGKNVKR